MIEMPSERKHWLDQARGIGILLVVYAHTQRGIERAGLAAHSGVLKILYDAIYSFHMPLFFVLAGYTAALSAKKGKVAFAISKIKGIAYPYLVWSLIVGAALLAAGNSTNGNALELYDLMAIPYKPIQHFWFLQALLLIEMLFIIINGVWLFLYISILLYISAALFLTHDTTFHNIAHFPIFFAAGTLLPNRSESGIDIPWPLYAIGFVATYSIAEISGFHYMDPAFLPASVFGIYMVAAISKQIGNIPWLSFIGRISLTIYVAHILFASGVRIALMKLGVAPNITLYLALCTAAGIIGPLLMQRVMERLNILWVLGLGKRIRR